MISDRFSCCLPVLCSLLRMLSCVPRFRRRVITCIRSVCTVGLCLASWHKALSWRAGNLGLSSCLDIPSSQRDLVTPVSSSRPTLNSKPIRFRPAAGTFNQPSPEIFNRKVQGFFFREFFGNLDWWKDLWSAVL